MDEWPPGVVVAGTGSGVGKTVVTLALLTALSEDDTVQPAKAGPDFIDPRHHRVVTDRHARTLDPWLQGEVGLRRNYARGEGDICVIEGMMGLFDGRMSSTADVAAALDLPVVLVVDASASMDSVGATALGFDQYSEEIDIAGIIAQQAHGGRHEVGIEQALPAGIEYLGRIPPDERLTIPDRHLGLHTDPETTPPEDVLRAAAASLKTERLRAIARRPAGSVPERDPAPTTSGVHVGMAQDAAFQFWYPATVERFREQGRLTTFSPLAGDPVPDCDILYLPGGYPEVHAPQLAESRTLSAIATRAADGVPVVGECGGLMALAEAIRIEPDSGTNLTAGTHGMAGVLPATIQFDGTRGALDYTELRARQQSPVGTPGGTYRGHAFHYSTATVDSDARFAFEVTRGAGITAESDGLMEYRTVGTYTHFHPASGVFDQLLMEGL